MRLVTFRAGGGAPQLGGMVGDSVVALRPALDAALRAGGEPARAAALIPEDTAALIADEAAMVAASRALAFAARPENGALRVPRSGVELLAPLRPGKIIGIGRNYAEHAKEAGGPKQEAPRIFLKPTSAVAGPGCVVRIPKAVRKPDYEAELGVVIGREAREVDERVALDHVVGYTALNDISAREFQFDVNPPQTSFAKGMDGFCPIGPWIATADEVGEPWRLSIRCMLNGETVQDGNTAGMIFPVPALIAYLSRYLTLHPGDLIATGTPAGPGAFRNPPRWLKPGDRLRIEIERVGELDHAIG
jgi:2-keto-4-pentenoate hydratase/2-oxohepta-3-ene-1,7-dioic acid hydratase in catechol pathway